ncbi:MFS general substrate transporter [Hypoxylon sp. FL0543]|nr:MFS general substrate transporter [Hypoxylon sp. FL0543]
MASSAEDDSLGQSHHHEDLEGRLPADSLLAEHEPLAPHGVILPDSSESTSHRKSWLVYLAASSALLCMFTINFDLLFLSTNYSKRIASDLHQLSSAVWIVLVGSITETASQPVYAYLCEAQGRKRAFLLAASLTTIGFFFCSLSTQLLQIVLSRLVVGSGCSGFSLVVTIIINDNVPLRDFALWRSLLIFIQMAGDISGGPLGSAIADASGWQMVFRIETIVMFCGLAVASCSLRISTTQSEDSPKPRIDLVPILLLFVTIALPLFALNLGGVVFPWDHPTVITLFACTPIALGGLLLATARHSEASSVLRKISNRPAVPALFATAFFVVYAFNALTYSMAVYIEARSFDNPSAFGDWALSCIFLSRPLGTFLAGLFIKRYRAPWGMLRCNMIVYFILYLFVSSGRIPLERPATAPYLLLIGLSLGASESCLIVSLFTAVQKKEQASLLAVFNVVVAFAGDVGVGVSLALTENFLRQGLYRELAGIPNYEEIISRALGSLDSIRDIPRAEQAKVIAVYINSIEKVLAISCATLLVSIVATISQKVAFQDENEPERREQEDTSAIR